MRILSRAFASLILVSTASTASAAFIELDLLAPGDRLVTRDTELGLDWLDVYVTANTSADQIRANAGGWVADGWRHATTAETCSLMIRLLPPGTDCPGVNFSADSVLSLTSLFSTDPDYIAGYFADDSTSNVVGLVEARNYLSGGSSWAVYAVGAVGSWTGAPAEGNFLVRPIPEPMTASLLSLGLLGLAYRQRRRRAASLALHRTLAFGVQLCLAAGPSHALTFSTSGPGMAPCGDQMCVDVSWLWGGGNPLEQTTESSGQISLVLPVPDPEVWRLSGGGLSSGAGAFFGGWFDPSDLPPDPVETIVGVSRPEYLVLGANGAVLTRNGAVLGATNCHPSDLNSEPAVVCSDSNAILPDSYNAVPGDEAFLGPLTLTYDFDPDWLITPLSEFYGVGFGGGAHLIYDLVPEPNTGVLLMTGLLGLAYRQRRQGRAAGASR